jgi:hypothetical protein
MSRPLFIGVRTRPGTPQRDTPAWVKAAIIGSRSHIESLRNRRMTGARRNPDEDADIVVSAGVTLYKLTPDPEFITPGEDLVVVHPGESSERPPEQIVLYIRKRS